MSEDVSAKHETLSYTLADVPRPLTNPDWYMRAQLVEMRATRAQLTRLNTLLERLVETLENKSSDTKGKK